MSQYICPSCGSGYFRSSRIGPNTIFQVESERVVHVIESSNQSQINGDIDQENICCGACSWGGRLDELVTSDKD